MKTLQLAPLELTKLHRLPPLEISRENAPTTPSNLRNFIDYPPPPRRNSPQTCVSPQSMESRYNTGLSFPSHSVSTRSSDSLVLSIPYVRSSLGKRAFSVIDPRLWNSLPPDTRNSSSLPIFRSRLKTHLFKIAFPP